MNHLTIFKIHTTGNNEYGNLISLTSTPGPPPSRKQFQDGQASIKGKVFATFHPVYRQSQVAEEEVELCRQFLSALKSGLQKIIVVEVMEVWRKVWRERVKDQKNVGELPRKEQDSFNSSWLNLC